MHTEIKTAQELENLLSSGKTEFDEYLFRDLDFSAYEGKIKGFSNCIFLGCSLTPKAPQLLMLANAIDDKGDPLNSIVSLPQKKLPFNPQIKGLYTTADLYGEAFGKSASVPPIPYDKTPDAEIYEHFDKYRKKVVTPLVENTLAWSLHDHAITAALNEHLEPTRKKNERKIVAIMGGHSTVPRGDQKYREVALLAKNLSEKGYTVVSGGGPGAMEAVHLGVWFTGREESELTAAIDTLQTMPEYIDGNNASKTQWLKYAHDVMVNYPKKQPTVDIAIPTWFYGFEPSTPFATYIAKYFDNSVREDGLVTIAKGGIIFAPGSAGTLQEVFQDLAQNHYATNKDNDYSSPMIFFKRENWAPPPPAMLDPLRANSVIPNVSNKAQWFEAISKFCSGKNYAPLLSLTDNIQTVVKELEAFSNPKLTSNLQPAPPLTLSNAGTLAANSALTNIVAANTDIVETDNNNNNNNKKRKIEVAKK